MLNSSSNPTNKTTIMKKNLRVFGARMITTIPHVIFPSMKWTTRYTDMVHFVDQNVRLRI